MGASTGSLLVPDDDGVAEVLRHVNRRATFHSEDEYRLAERRPLARTGRLDQPPGGAGRGERDPLDAAAGGLAEQLGKRIHVLHVTTAEEIAYLAITRRWRRWR
jgi:dihydroorotase